MSMSEPYLVAFFFVSIFIVYSFFGFLYLIYDIQLLFNCISFSRAFYT